MIIDDLHIFGTYGCPAEADAELIVHADAVLARPVSLQRFKPVTVYPALSENSSTRKEALICPSVLS